MTWSDGNTGGGGGGAVNSVIGVPGKTLVNDLGGGNLEVTLDDPLVLDMPIDLKETMTVDPTDGQIDTNGKISL